MAAAAPARDEVGSVSTVGGGGGVKCIFDSCMVLSRMVSCEWGTGACMRCGAADDDNDAEASLCGVGKGVCNLG